MTVLCVVAVLLVGSALGTSQTYTKFHSGRRVCSMQKDLTTSTYGKPTYKFYSQRCRNNQVCKGVRAVFEPTPGEPSKPRLVQTTTYVCCPGWGQVNKINHGCKQPLCKRPCQNGGTCSGPQTCTCRAGFTGVLCQHDIDECTEHKPCDHLCYNTHGSYYCKCKPTFILQPDNQSCRRDEQEEKTAFEAEDLDCNNRISKLEKFINSYHYTDSASSINELRNKLDNAIRDIKTLEYNVNLSMKNSYHNMDATLKIGELKGKLDDAIKEINILKSYFRRYVSESF